MQSAAAKLREPHAGNAAHMYCSQVRSSLGCMRTLCCCPPKSKWCWGRSHHCWGRCMSLRGVQGDAGCLIKDGAARSEEPFPERLYRIDR